MMVQIFQRQHTYDVQVAMRVWECPMCGIVYGIPRDFADHCRATGQRYYCPNGHSLGWSETDSDRLKKAEAREVGLTDQLRAAEADAEQTRTRLLRDRHRFANGVCPCCNRTFSNVARHMATKHPDFDPGAFVAPRYECSCGSTFETHHGLRVHQGKSRPSDWLDTKHSKWRRHLTVVNG